MKINYKNTALSLLENPKDFSMHTPDEYNKPMTTYEDLKLMNGIIDSFAVPGFADPFKKNIQLVTQPFYQAYLKSRSKLKDLVQETEFDDAGTLIIPWPDHTQTFFYSIESNGNKDNWKYKVWIFLFTKTPRNDSFALDIAVYLGKEPNEVMDIVWKGFVNQGRDMSWWIAELMLFKTFLKFVDIETKIVNVGKKERHLGEKYVNESKQKVEVLDSTYFTTISRTEGFGVSGHFRLQPYGPGLASRRLQWIAEYKKTGYHREAKILRDGIGTE